MPCLCSGVTSAITCPRDPTERVHTPPKIHSFVDVQAVASEPYVDGSDGFITQVYDEFAAFQRANDNPECWDEVQAFYEVRSVPSLVAAARLLSVVCLAVVLAVSQGRRF